MVGGAQTLSESECMSDQGTVKEEEEKEEGEEKEEEEEEG